MDRMEHEEKDSAQKAKLIFFSLAGLVVVLLIWSFVSAGRARSERNAALQELEACKQDNAKITQWLDERTKEADTLKKDLEKCKTKSKGKTAAKGKTTSKSAAKKKSSKTGKSK